MASSTKKTTPTASQLGGQGGFSLIEVLMAVSLLTIVMVGGFSANSLAANGASINKLRNRANLLAKEGIEALQSVRASNFQALTLGTFHPVLNSGSWVLSPGEEVLGKHTRKITLSPVMRDLVCGTPVCGIVTAGGLTDPLTLRAEVTVSWKENDQDKRYRLYTLLTYWK